MLPLLKDKNPVDVHIFCKTDNQYPSKFHNQSSEMLPFEDYGNETVVFDDMLGSKETKDIDAFLLVVATKSLIFITSLNLSMNYLKTIIEINVVGLSCFHEH